MKPNTHLRMTYQRKVILEEIKKLATHPTADELYSVVRMRVPHISLGTVYRNLDTLHREGTIEKLDLAGFQSRYDGNTLPHHHLRCQFCNRIEDVETDGVHIQTSALQGKSEYRVTGYRLEFTGICPDCQGSSTGESSHL